MAQKDTKIATASNRILLHLLEFKSYTDELEGPMGITQIGVAEAIDVARGNITRSIEPLIENGWVENKKVHVPGFRQKRTIYYLTANGHEQASLVKRSIEEQKIQVIFQDGESQNIALREVQKALPFSLRFVDIVRISNKMKLFDCNAYLESKRKVGACSPDYLKEKMNIPYFYGRSKEIEQANEWAKSKDSYTLIIKGFPGIGKTSFLINMMENIGHENSKFYYKVQPWCTLRSVIQSMAQFFEKLGMKELGAYIINNNSIDLSEIEYLISEILSDKTQIYFIIDDFQKSNEDIKMLVSMLHNSMAQNKLIKLIVAGRTIEPFYNHHDAISRKTVFELTLEGLDRESTKELAQNLHISQDDIKEIYKQTNGHPLFVELLSQGSLSRFNTNLESYVNDEFIQSLSSHELDVLKYVSIHRYPVDRNSLRTHQKSLIDLINQSIFKQLDDGKIELHDVLRTTINNGLNEHDIIYYHSEAAEHYLEELTTDSTIEALYHLLKAKQFDDTIQIILDKKDQLILSDRKEELSKIISSLLNNPKLLKDENKANILLFQGDLLTILGEWDDAILKYKEVRTELSSEDITCMKSKMGMAEIMLMKNYHEDAKNLFNDILLWASNNNEEILAAEAYYQIGSVYERLQKYDVSLNHFEESIKFSIKTLNKKQLAKACYGEGRIYHQNQDYEIALNKKKEALKIALRIGNNNLASKILTSIGNTYDRMNLLDKEIETHEEAIALARKNGAVRTLAYALSNAGAAYMDNSNIESSMKYIDEAALIFDKLGEKYMIATTSLNMALNMLLQEEINRAFVLFDQCKDILIQINNKEKLMDSYYRFGIALNKIECLDKARIFLNKALELSNELGDVEASRQISKEIIN